MYAFVGNGFQGIVKTQEALQVLLSLYPYPKFRKQSTEEEARKWLSINSRKYNNFKRDHYGDCCDTGFAKVEYFIYDGCLFYNIFTDKVGRLLVEAKDSDTSILRSPDNIAIKIKDTNLKEQLITHHCIALLKVLTLIGPYIDVDLVLPDMSILLAITAYTGSAYLIRSLQKTIKERIGGVSYTIR